VIRVPRSAAMGKLDAASLAALSQALPVFAEILAPYLRPLLAPEDAFLVDVANAVPTSRRSLYAACRRGEIDGAVRVARRWLAPKASLDTWLRARGPRLVTSTPEEEDDDLEPLRRRLAARRVAR
jgi:hypothetical protein